MKASPAAAGICITTVRPAAGFSGRKLEDDWLEGGNLGSMLAWLIRNFMIPGAALELSEAFGLQFRPVGLDYMFVPGEGILFLSFQGSMAFIVFVFLNESIAITHFRCKGGYDVCLQSFAPNLLYTFSRLLIRRISLSNFSIMGWEFLMKILK